MMPSLDACILVMAMVLDWAGEDLAVVTGTEDTNTGWSGACAAYMMIEPIASLLGPSNQQHAREQRMKD